MWILPKQLHISVYALDTRALVLDSEAFSQLCEKSLTWRGKDSLSRTWLQRWKRESWMQHLCSRTLKPSHTESFVDSWTSFPEDSRVSHSQLLESVKLLKTPDTSSPTSQTELESANLELFSLKTYKESSAARQPTESQFSSMSSEHWKDWVIEQRQEYSQRKKSARLIRESESSSLGWSTPIVGDAHLASNPEAAQKRLAEGKSTLSRQVEAKSWPTATVFDTTGGSYPTEMVDGVYRSKHSQEPNSPWYGAKLKDAVETHEENWATPIANDAKGSDYAGTKENPKALYLGGQVKNWLTPRAGNPSSTQCRGDRKGPNGENIPSSLDSQVPAEEAKNWQTPTTMDIERTPEGMEKRKAYRESIGRKYVEGCLTEQVKNWATPSTMDHINVVRKPEERSEKANKGGCKNLREEVMQPQNWPTASARDWKDTAGMSTERDGKALGRVDQLPRAVYHHDGLQDQANPNTNGKSQESWPTPRANKVHPEITEKNREHLANRKKANLEEDIAGHCGKATGKLNRNWVEHLMGLPAGWTDLGSWETE